MVSELWVVSDNVFDYDERFGYFERFSDSGVSQAPEMLILLLRLLFSLEIIFYLSFCF